MPALPILSSYEFDTEVLKSDKPVVVEFFASWCHPCHEEAPLLDALADEKAETLKIVKVDIEASRDIQAKYFVSATPTLVLIRNGEMIARAPGVGSPEFFNNWVEQALAQPADYKLVIVPVKLNDAEKSKLRAAFEEAVSKNPDAKTPYILNGETTTMEKALKDDLDSGIIVRQMESILTENGGTLDDMLARVKSQPMPLPPGAKLLKKKL